MLLFIFDSNLSVLKSVQRLYYIDAIRAWAILMMLQGHFIDGLLDPAFRDKENELFSWWLYFRGITAPVFFTVSGFIVSYLLLSNKAQNHQNPRIKKSLKRGIELIFYGYLLRLSFGGLFKGQLYNAFYQVDVLHCIGLALLSIVLLYKVHLWLCDLGLKWAYAIIQLSIVLLLFLGEPYYKTIEYEYLPKLFANYLNKANGSVFTIIPWLAYSSFGALLSQVYLRFQNKPYFYPFFILSSLLSGLLLIHYSSEFFTELITLHSTFGFLQEVVNNNYLFIRLGDVLIVFAVFASLRGLAQYKIIVKIGQSTLTTYIIHYIILYGSFTGHGLYRFYKKSLNWLEATTYALLFMLICTLSAVVYHHFKPRLKTWITCVKHDFLKRLKQLL